MKKYWLPQLKSNSFHNLIYYTIQNALCVRKQRGFKNFGKISKFDWLFLLAEILTICIRSPRPPKTKPCHLPCPCCIKYVFIIAWSRECRLSTVSIAKCVNNIPSKYFYLITENYAFSYPQVSHYFCLNYEKYAFNKYFVISIHEQWTLVLSQ